MKIAIVKLIIVRFIGLYNNRVSQAVIVMDDIIVIYVFQFIDPSAHSYIVPKESTAINRIVLFV